MVNVNIYIDIPALKTGGVESFSINTGISLTNKGYNVFLIKSIAEESLGNDELSKIKSSVNVIDLNEFLLMSKKNNKRHIIVTSWNIEIFKYLEEIVEAHKYKSLVQIIGYLHSDATYYYDMIKTYEPIISKFICVSEIIQNKMFELFPKRSDDIVFKQCPTSISHKNKVFNTDNKNKLRLLFVGRIEESSKGIFKLVQIYKELVNKNIPFILDIVGVGTDLDKLKKLFYDFDQAEHANFIEDALTPASVKPFYEKADIFILTSNYEGGPIVIYEAMACKVVPISFDVGNVKNIIINEENGYIIENKSIQKIIDKIIELNADRKKLKRFGEKAYQVILEKGYFQDSYDDFFIKLVESAIKLNIYKNFNQVKNNLRIRNQNLGKWVETFIPEEINKQYQISSYINTNKSNSLDTEITNKKTTQTINELQYQVQWYKNHYDKMPQWYKKFGGIVRHLNRLVHTSPKITVIIPVYNVEKYIITCVESVINQSFGINNIEILIIDDLSNDKSIELIKNKYLPKYKKQLKIITHEVNKGLGGARNTGIKFAKSEYIFFLDSDDAIYPKALESLYDSITLNNTDVAIGGINNYNGDLEYIDKYAEFPYSVVRNYSEKFKKNKENTINITVWNKLYKRSLLSNEFLMKTLFEDEIYTFELCTRIDSLSFISEPVYKYRRREGSITTVNFNLNHLNSLYSVYRETFKIIKSEGFTEKIIPWLDEKIDVVFRKFTLNDYQKIQYFDLINKNLEIFPYESLVDSGVLEFLSKKIESKGANLLNGYINKYMYRKDSDLLENTSDKLSLAIIIPIYNAENHICKLLDSIVNQYLNGVEVILVNNNSSDKTEALIKPYIKDFSFIKYYALNENLGAGAARNYGLKQTSCEYILFHDADDYIDCNAFNMINYNIKKYNKPDAIIFSFTVYHHNNIFSWSCKEIEKLSGKSNGKDVLLKVTDNTKVNPAPWNKVFKRSIWLDNNLFFPEDIHHQDLAVIPFACYLSNRIIISPYRIYNYINHKVGVSAGATDLHVESPFGAINYLFKFIENNNNKDFKKYSFELNRLALLTFYYNYNLRKEKFSESQKYAYKKNFQVFEENRFKKNKNYPNEEYDNLKKLLSNK